MLLVIIGALVVLVVLAVFGLLVEILVVFEKISGRILRIQGSRFGVNGVP